MTNSKSKVTVFGLRSSIGPEPWGSTDHEDPFSPARIRREKRFARSVEGLPSEWLQWLKRKKQGQLGNISSAARLRAAQGIPEAIVKIVSYGSGKDAANRQLDYISRRGALEVEMSDGTSLYGKEDIRDLVEDWSADFHSRKGRARHTIHLVVSAPQYSDRKAVMEAGRGFAIETFGDNHPFAIVRHDDEDHPHVHIVARMRGEDGCQFCIEPGGFHDLRERFARNCRERGIEMNATPRQLRGASRSEPQSLYQMRRRGRTPDIDRRAAAFIQAETKPTTVMKFAKVARSERLREEAGEHRRLAEAFDAVIPLADQRDQEVFGQQARLLRDLANYVEVGGDLTRPDRIRGDRMMSERPGHGAQIEKQDAALVLEKAHQSALRGSDIARRMIEKLEPGPDRDKAIAAAKALETAQERLAPRRENSELAGPSAPEKVVSRDARGTKSAERQTPGHQTQPAYLAEIEKIRERTRGEKEREDRSRDRD